MVEVTPHSRPLTAEDLPDLPPEEERSDLVAGALVREPPPGEEHGGVAVAVAAPLYAFVREHTVHRPGRRPTHLGPHDLLDGSPCLPGLRLPVTEVFEV